MEMGEFGLECLEDLSSGSFNWNFNVGIHAGYGQWKTAFMSAVIWCSSTQLHSALLFNMWKLFLFETSVKKHVIQQLSLECPLSLKHPLVCSIQHHAPSSYWWSQWVRAPTKTNSNLVWHSVTPSLCFFAPSVDESCVEEPSTAKAKAKAHLVSQVLILPCKNLFIFRQWCPIRNLDACWRMGRLPRLSHAAFLLNHGRSSAWF